MNNFRTYNDPICKQQIKSCGLVPSHTHTHASVPRQDSWRGRGSHSLLHITEEYAERMVVTYERASVPPIHPSILSSGMYGHRNALSSLIVDHCASFVDSLLI